MARAFEAERVLRLPLMAHLSTICPEGPRGTPVWFLWEEGVLWIPGDTGSHFVQRIEADPRVAVDIVEYDNAAGILQHVGLRGSAELGDTDVPARFGRVLAKYLGPDRTTWNAWFVERIARIDDPATRMIRLVPDSIFTNDVSYFRTGPDLAVPRLGPEGAEVPEK